MEDFFLDSFIQLRQKALSDQDTNGRWGVKDEGEQMDNRPISNIPVSTSSSKTAVSQPTVSKVKRRLRYQDARNSRSPYPF